MVTTGANTSADRHDRLTPDQMPPGLASGGLTGVHAPGTLGAALAAARRGWRVFPLAPGTKDRPVVKNWPARCCGEVATVARCWPSPRHNIGICCGCSRIVVIDLDTHGQLPAEWVAEPGIRDGCDVFAFLCEAAGQPWPDTYTVSTPTGGIHMYFTASAGLVIGNSRARLGPMVDTRGDRGYVIAAGLVLPGAGRWEVVHDPDVLAPLPGWAVADLTAQPPAPRPAPGCRRTRGGAWPDWPPPSAPQARGNAQTRSCGPRSGSPNGPGGRRQAPPRP